MPNKQQVDEQLRTQIEAYSAKHFSTHQVEQRIAASLKENGRFHDGISSDELTVILRNIVYTLFAQQKFAGRDVSLVHNVPKMKVSINDSEAKVKFIVHIHKPIVAFLEFSYTLVNDPVSAGKTLRVKHGTLQIAERTRRFDIKAKAALATINLDGMARKELADLTRVIRMTLPPQLSRHGISGRLSTVELALKDQCLSVLLEGDFEVSAVDQPT